MADGRGLLAGEVRGLVSGAPVGTVSGRSPSELGRRADQRETVHRTAQGVRDVPGSVPPPPRSEEAALAARTDHLDAGGDPTPGGQRARDLDGIPTEVGDYLLLA